MRRLSLFLIAAAGLGMIMVGLRYLIADQFMPYHAQVAQATWADLRPGVRAVILGLLTIVGAGFIASGTALLWLLPSIKAGKSRVHWAVLCIGLAIGLPTLYVTLKLRQEVSVAETPVALTAALLACVVFGGLAYMRSLRSGTRSAPIERTESVG